MKEKRRRLVLVIMALALGLAEGRSDHRQHSAR